MSLNYTGSRNGAQRNLTEPIVITTGDVVAVGDLVEVYTAGTAGNPTAAQIAKGIVHSIVDSKGLPLVRATHTAGTAHTGDTVSVTGDGTQYVLIDTSPDSLYSAEVNGTVGTTNNSGAVGARVDIDSAGSDWGRLLETTATRTIGTPAQFYVHKTDSQDSTRLIVSFTMPEEMSVME